MNSHIYIYICIYQFETRFLATDANSVRRDWLVCDSPAVASIIAWSQFIVRHILFAFLSPLQVYLIYT